MSTDGLSRPEDVEYDYKPYDQFILFGDSITQGSSSQERGFGFQPALQDGESTDQAVLRMHYSYPSLHAPSGRDQPGIQVCQSSPVSEPSNSCSGYTTAHAVKMYPKFFPTLQTASVRLMVRYCTRPTTTTDQYRPSSSALMTPACPEQPSMSRYPASRQTSRPSSSIPPP